MVCREEPPIHLETESFIVFFQEREQESDDVDLEIMPILPLHLSEKIELWFINRALTHPISTKEGVNLMGGAINDALARYGIVDAPKYNYSRCQAQRSLLPRLEIQEHGRFLCFSLSELIGWILSIPKYRFAIHTTFEDWYG